jgi:hypothetical protein
VTGLLLLSAALTLLPGLGRPEPPPSYAITESREPCANRDPLRRPFFGDTHVHTAFSFDAMGQGTRGTPRDAWRFARGEPLGLQPYAADDTPGRTVRLRRPLDFAVVTDHAELLGETRMCTTPFMPGYDSYVCRVVRGWPRLGYILVNSRAYSMQPPRRLRFCGEDGERCREAADDPWQRTREAAEEAYDRSPACAFTSFVGYEWTGMPGGANVHRNLVFRNERVPARPASYLDAHTAEALWSAIEEDCLARGDGCDAIAIPHNSNVSDGRMWPVARDDGSALTREDARRRAALEVLVEVIQHKGDSECRAGGPDELCGFETLPWNVMADSALSWRWGEVAPRAYVREALGEGLVQHARIGANPFRFGLIGSTDTHLATPGLVDEDMHGGHAAGTVSSRLAIPPIPDQVHFNPGGLAVLWAEENSRDALFAAMRRREAYGTSGPRIALRFFGGWEYPEALCGSDEFAARGYADGVPMGGELPERPEVEGAPAPAPTFAVWALRDAGTPDFPGTPLQRIQIVKIALADGAPVERVIDVAGTADAGADVDLATCTPRGAGADQLCQVWRDPDFDPDAPALYYARAVESPSCRWQTYVCNRAGVRCGNPSTIGPGLDACCDDAVPKTIQERAWSSPIWYAPALP